MTHYHFLLHPKKAIILLNITGLNYSLIIPGIIIIIAVIIIIILVIISYN